MNWDTSWGTNRKAGLRESLTRSAPPRPSLRPSAALRRSRGSAQPSSFRKCAVAGGEGRGKRISWADRRGSRLLGSNLKSLQLAHCQGRAGREQRSRPRACRARGRQARAGEGTRGGTERGLFRVARPRRGIGTVRPGLRLHTARRQAASYWPSVTTLAAPCKPPEVCPSSFWA